MKIIIPKPLLGRAIAPPGFRPKWEHEVNDFVSRSVKVDSKDFARSRQYLQGDRRSFAVTPRQRAIMSLIRKRNKKTGKSYLSRGKVLI